MKAIVIENEYDLPEELQGFLDDNPDLFESVDVQVACRHRPLQDVGRFVAVADAVIVMSTFMYKDQLEDFVEAFTDGALAGKKYKFYIWSAVHHFNEWNWKREDDSYQEEFRFSAIETFLSQLRTLVQEHEVYSIEPDHDLPYEQWNKEGFGPSKNFKRPPLHAVRVHYSPELDFYYLEGDDPKEEKDEFAELA